MKFVRWPPVCNSSEEISSSRIGQKVEATVQGYHLINQLFVAVFH